MSKSIEIILNSDGTVNIDSIGYVGESCKEDIETLINGIITPSNTELKEEYYKQSNEGEQEQQIML